jgi:hypothetical protein
MPQNENTSSYVQARNYQLGGSRADTATRGLE